MMKVAELMTRDVTLAEPGATLPQIAVMMRDQDLGAVPIEENDRLVGMVTDRDIVVRGLANTEAAADSITARDVMSDSAVYYCYADQTPEDVLENMSDLQIRRLPVVDRDKRLVGIVSLGDLAGSVQASSAGKTLEDISRQDAA